MPRSHPTPTLPAPEPGPRRLPPLLRRAWYGLNQAFRRRIAHLAITPDQFSILRWLTEGDRRGLTQREITELMAADANTVAAILRRMEEAGLISRTVHEADRRAHRVQVKAPGRRKFIAAQQIAVELQEDVLAALPAPELARFLEQLEVVAGACQDAVDGK
ncbi:MarR family winged helix-turn-helix transcriptional regulator [Horticoccus sp. 23ND18S-11]|uniref:MarR family winged helix-turn-helix transcriptional regulator n=1 Tax=Horticoccus sp. 23ND18S-11 TaxID=3391832 RepID=UPI0039C95846